MDWKGTKRTKRTKGTKMKRTTPELGRLPPSLKLRRTSRWRRSGERRRAMHKCVLTRRS
jgi:hypothetical protein